MIEVRDFSKSFGEHSVVRDLNFSVGEGEIFAFLGANGSGKTTTIRTLLGIYQPTSGELLINGKSFDHSMSSLIGYLPEERGLYLSSKALETMVYFGTLKGLSADEATIRSQEYLEQVGLSGKENLEIKKLSSGQQQKLQLGIALINKPKLLILDEPTKGLDPVNRSLLMDRLMELNKQGSTIVFVSHQMDEVEKIADRLVMIKDGKRVLYGGMHEVKAQFGSNTIHIEFDGEFPLSDDLYDATVRNRQAEVAPKEGVSTDKVIEYLVQHNIQIQKFDVGTPSLQEVFVRISNDNNQ